MDRPRYAAVPQPSSLELSSRPFPSAPPAGAVRALIWLRGALGRLARAIGPAELGIFEDIGAAALLPVLAALIKRGVPEALADGALSTAELARRTGTNEDALFRALRSAALRGYFRLRGDGRFEHNAGSRALLGGRLSCAREFLAYFASGSNQAAWQAFDHALVTGKSPFDHVHGMNVWQWFDEHPDERELFAHAMMGITTGDAPVVATLYPFAELRRVCDVGGGRGTLLSELLIRHPHLEGVLYESAGVLESAKKLLDARGVLGRVTLSAGNFFEQVPAGADAYLLKNILHDWSDPTSIAILKNVRAAAGASGKVLLVEVVVERVSRDTRGVPADLQMMVACSDGRERGRAEYARLLEQAGFRLGRVFTYPTVSVLEGLPV
jgi:O-methyltransferase